MPKEKELDRKELKAIRRNLISAVYDKSLSEQMQYCLSLVKDCEIKKGLRANQIKGEVAELSLKLILMDLEKILKANGFKCFISKNLALVSTGANGQIYSSELDVSFMTEYRIYLFEVKCYSGYKTLTAECNLRGRESVDIYLQSRSHLSRFDQCFDKCRIKYSNRGEGDQKLPSPYKLIFYELSEDGVEDKRTKEWQQNIPYYNYKTFHSKFCKDFMNSAKLGKPQWNLKQIAEEVKRYEDKYDEIMDFHLKRLEGNK